MTTPQVQPMFLVDVAKQIIHRSQVEWHAFLLTSVLKDPRKSFRRRVANINLIADAPKEGFIREFVGFKVCGENHNGVKGNLKYLPRMEGEVIHPFLKGHNPTVE